MRRLGRCVACVDCYHLVHIKRTPTTNPHHPFCVQAEGKNSKRWFDGGAAQAQYESYFETTSPFWLFPPQLYALLPTPLRRLLCCELPMYAYQSQELDVLNDARTEAGAGYVAPNSEEIGR